MSTSNLSPCDIAIAGGGLAGALIALALARLRPELDVRLVEAEPQFGGNHIWSFFDSDIDAQDRWLVDPLIAARWADYDIEFPAHRRTLATGYNSLTSEALDAQVRKVLGPRAISGAAVARIMPDGLKLADGRMLEARGVIDARGGGDLSMLDLGWQKFLGQEVQLAAPHGLDRPVVMDATVPQIDGYRFIYLLPFGPDRLFVEDTYYSDTPELDRDLLAARIADYCAARGWQIKAVLREERGALPVLVGGDFDTFWPADDRCARAGVRAGLFHPTTGYSLPDAIGLARHLATLRDFDSASLAVATRGYARATWRARGFYRMLDTMLFHAAEPAQRYRILERFYRLNARLIGRFYAGNSLAVDKIRVLSGKPPVPLWSAIRALWGAR